MDNQEDQVRTDVGGWISGPCLSRPLNQPHGMSAEDATSLWHLRCLWGDRYQVTYAAGIWHAARLGSFGTFDIDADSAIELRSLISEHYQVWQAETRNGT
jgi:hypothetical protein